MTVEFALDYIPRRMKEMGYGDNYIIRWRHFQLLSGEVLSLPSYNEYFLLINPIPTLEVRSKTGHFNLTDITINEMQYEHRGKIDVKNTVKEDCMVLFIQVIPNHK